MHCKIFEKVFRDPLSKISFEKKNGREKENEGVQVYLEPSVGVAISR
jgi:hypothetical protein